MLHHKTGALFLIVSKLTLRLLSALVWYAGGAILLYKGSGYVLGAAALRPESWLPWVGAATGVLVGAARGRRAFARGCRKNLARIDALEAPKVWQFFRPGFFLALAAMIGGGVVLRMIADAGGFWASLVVGSLELVIALALLTSSVELWRWRPGDPVDGTGRAGRARAGSGARGGAAAAGDVA